jgi:hypothetical protein
MYVSGTVHAEPTDQMDSPRYRVNFWERASGSDACRLDAFVLSDVGDVEEVLRWIEGQSQGRAAEVFVEIADQPVGEFGVPRTASLLRLLGVDPNAGASVEIGRFEGQ